MPFFVGDWVHQGMAKIYSAKTKKDRALAVKSILSGINEYLDTVFIPLGEEAPLDKAIATVRGILEGYCLFYDVSKERTEYKKVRIEQPFNFHLKQAFVDQAGGANMSVLVHGTIDKTVLDSKGAWLWENKTAGQIGKDHFSRLPMDAQLLTYMVAMKYFKESLAFGEPVRGVVYNVCKKTQLRGKDGESRGALIQRVVDDYLTRPEFYFQRQKIQISASHTRAHEQDIAQIAVAIKQMRERQASYQKPWRAWTKHTTQCQNRYGQCNMYKPCLYDGRADTVENLYQLRGTNVQS